MVAYLLGAWRAPATLFYVGKRRPASELPPDQLERIRDAYRDTGWASDYSVEATGVYTTRSGAAVAANIPGGFYHELPVDRSLPDLPVIFRRHLFPRSGQIYKSVRAPFVVFERDKLTRVVAGISEVQSILNE